MKHDAKIEVVLRSDNPTTQNRYKGFFGKRDIEFKLEGVEDYIDKLI